MDTAISVKNISKKYELSHHAGAPYLTLRNELVNLVRKPVRWLAGHRETREEFWALKDISFEVKRGEVLGIIGANGAGKSTLLKILSRITPPTSGEVRINGRVSSLLEVGTGFHPELTGRENIYLNGAILGMPRKEIERNFALIVEFAGIEKFLDTPVKHYSSGMYVRLAFAVAAHLDPDILLVDEVLAVGDSEFQKKSLGKMEEVAKTAGRTILFVSHNMDAVASICRTCVLFEKGRVKMIGPAREVIAAYLKSPEKVEAVKTFAPDPKKTEAQLLRIAVLDEGSRPTTDLDMAKSFAIEIDYELKIDIPAYAVVKIFSTAIASKYILVTLSNDRGAASPAIKGRYRARVAIDPLLNTGMYSFLAGVATHTEDYLDSVTEYDALRIQNLTGLWFETKQHGRSDAIIVTPLRWSTHTLTQI